VVGRKEAEERTVALRRLGGAAQEVLTLDEAVALLVREATAPDLRPIARPDEKHPETTRDDKALNSLRSEPN
jgi:hypothetical protein